jgi:uncharacterized glyoxalase superfamily protein PhnB
MKAPPADWPRLSSALCYRDAAKAIDWICAAFGFAVRLKVEGDGGSIVHSELVFGEALIMVHDERDAERFGIAVKSPLSAQCVTQSLMLYVDDVDAHCAKARAHGATIVAEPALHDYGDDYWCDRSYGALDCESHVWWFTERIRTGKA